MNYEKMDDVKLVKHLRRNPGDEHGWTAMLKRYHRLMWWRIIHHTGEENHELYQDVQYAVRDRLINRYSGRGSVLSHVSGTIVDQTKSKQRIGAKEPQKEMDEVADAVPDQSAMENETARRVLDLLKGLKPKERKALILQYIGHSHRDIVRILGVNSARASRKHLSRLMDKVSYRSQRSGISPERLLYGIRILNRAGELYEMLGI